MDITEQYCATAANTQYKQIITIFRSVQRIMEIGRHRVHWNNNNNNRRDGVMYISKNKFVVPEKKIAI